MSRQAERKIKQLKSNFWMPVPSLALQNALMWEAEALLCRDTFFHSVPIRLYHVLYVHFMQCRDLTEQFPLILLLPGIKLAASFAFVFSLCAVNYGS